MARLEGSDRVTRDFLCVALRSFGEDVLAERAKEIAQRDVDRVNARVEQLMWSDIHPSRRSVGLRISYSLALAGVEVLEGKGRPLRLRRRRPYRADDPFKLPDDGWE